MEDKEFDNLLERQRKYNDLTLQEAADKIGCTKPHVHDMEKGKSTNPTVAVLIGIMDAYGLSADCVIDLYR